MAVASFMVLNIMTMQLDRMQARGGVELVSGWRKKLAVSQRKLGK